MASSRPSQNSPAITVEHATPPLSLTLNVVAHEIVRNLVCEVCYCLGHECDVRFTMRIDRSMLISICECEGSEADLQPKTTYSLLDVSFCGHINSRKKDAAVDVRALSMSRETKGWEALGSREPAQTLRNPNQSACVILHRDSDTTKA